MIFSSPSFLWALGLIAIPIIVHLFQFRRFKRLDFSDVSLLREIQTKSQTKNQLKHLLVLAARILFLAALIFAFAEPILPGKSDLAKQKPLISIYVDNSLSMQNRSGDGKLLQLALQRAFDISESYPKESKFQLITNDLTSNQRRFVDRESFLELLDEVEAGDLLLLP